MILPLLAMLACGAGPSAGQAPPPDERATARELSYAAYRLRVSIKAQKAEIERRLAAAVEVLDQPRCAQVLTAAPPRRRPHVIVVAVTAALLPVFDVLRPPTERFLGEIEAVRTADPALRSGRSAWRTTVAGLRTLPAIPDVCAALEAWRRGRFAPGSAPVDLAGLAGSRSLKEVAAIGERTAGKLSRAAARMRQLGVGAGAARRFTGETLLDGIGDDLGP